MFKKTQIDGYSGERLVSLKDNCNGKHHKEALCSFKPSVLKIQTEGGREEVDSSVSPDEFKQFNRKANIA